MVPNNPHNPPKSIKVHWFDPGVTTGYATGIIADGSMGVVSGQAKWNELEIYDELVRSKPDIIGYETFEYRKNVKTGASAKGMLFPRNLIGVINLYYYQRRKTDNPCGIFQQTPAQGLNGYFTDIMLKKNNVYKVTVGGHANSAMKHLLQWYTFGPGYKYNQHGYKGLA